MIKYNLKLYVSKDTGAQEKTHNVVDGDAEDTENLEDETGRQTK